MGSFSRSSVLCKLKRWVSFQDMNVANTEIDDNETSKIATQIFQQRNMLEKHKPHYLLKRSPFRGDELLCEMGFLWRSSFRGFTAKGLDLIMNITYVSKTLQIAVFLTLGKKPKQRQQEKRDPHHRGRSEDCGFLKLIKF